jgi:hypothetical protein
LGPVAIKNGSKNAHSASVSRPRIKSTSFQEAALNQAAIPTSITLSTSPSFLKEVLSEHFAAEKAFVALLTELIDRSIEIAAKRHALAHGRYEWTARLEGQSMVPAVRVIRQYKKTTQTFEFSVSDLLDVRYELANLAGKLSSICGCQRPDKWLQNVLPSAEISRLQQMVTKPT